LAKNPDVQDRLYRELKDILPDKNTSFDENSMEKMPYLKAVLKVFQNGYFLGGKNFALKVYL